MQPASEAQFHLVIIQIGQYIIHSGHHRVYTPTIHHFMWIEVQVIIHGYMCRLMCVDNKIQITNVIDRT